MIRCRGERAVANLKTWNPGQAALPPLPGDRNGAGHSRQ